MNSYSNYNRIWDHMPVVYYPTKEERRCCNGHLTLAGVMARLCQGRVMDISVKCFKGIDFDVENVPHINSIIHELGKRPERCWDFTDEYKKDYNNLKVINDFLKFEL